MVGTAVCSSCENALPDEKALVCPSCGYTLHLPKEAKLGLVVSGIGSLVLLVWAVTVRSIFAFLAWLVGLFYNPIANPSTPIRPGPAPDVRQLFGDPLGRWAGDLIDWLGLNPGLAPNDTLLWLGAASLFLGLGMAFYGATIVRRAQAEVAVA